MDGEVSCICCKLPSVSAADLVVLGREHVHLQDDGLCRLVGYYNDGTVRLDDGRKVEKEDE